MVQAAMQQMNFWFALDTLEKMATEILKTNLEGKDIEWKWWDVEGAKISRAIIKDKNPNVIRERNEYEIIIKSIPDEFSYSYEISLACWDRTVIFPVNYGEFTMRLDNKPEMLQVIEDSIKRAKENNMYYQKPENEF